MNYSWYERNENNRFETSDLQTEDINIDSDLESFFHEIYLLYKIPLRYLIANEKLVKEESFRFFRIDRNWLEAVIDGVCSVARIDSDEIRKQLSEKNRGTVHKYRSSLLHRDSEESIEAVEHSGFILRSRLVREYEGLELQGFDAEGSVLTLLRYEKLEDDMSIAIFNGELKKAVLSIPHESRSYGFDEDAEKKRTIRKKNFLDGSICDGKISINANDRKIDVLDFINNGLSDQKETHSGHFALAFLQPQKEVIINYEDRK